MDREVFDQLTRAVAARATRRRWGGTLLALGIAVSAGLQGFGAAESKAKQNRGTKHKKRKRKKRKTRPDTPPCAPLCFGNHCCPDGCGGSCGECGLLEQCVDGACEPSCLGSCTGKQCGPHCPGWPPDDCGVCFGGWSCVEGECLV